MKPILVVTLYFNLPSIRYF